MPEANTPERGARRTVAFAPAVFNLGETTRMVEIANEMRRLHGERYEYVFYGFSKTYRHIVEGNGYAYTLLDPVLSAVEESQIIKLDQMRTIRNPFTYRMVSQQVRNELAFLNRVNPEVVVTGTSPTVFLSARIARVPLIHVKPFALTRPYFSMDEAIVPYRLRNIPLAWSLLRKVMLNLRWRPRSFTRVAAEHALELPEYTFDLFDGDHNLLATDPLFVNEDALPDRYTTVGPIFSRSGEIPIRQIEDFVASARDLGKRVVFFAMGSSSNRKLVLKLLDYLVKSDFYVIAPLRKYLSDDDVAGLDNVLLLDFVPSAQVNPLADFAVTHGGEGTVQTACRSGKPFIGIGLQYEQEVNVRNCEKFGNAKFVHQRDIRKKTLDLAISEILSERCIERAVLMKKKADTTGAFKAAQFVNDLLDERLS